MKKITAQGIQISLFQRNEDDYISLTDIARYKNQDDPRDVVRNWIRNKNTIEYLGFWELINNPDFKPVEFDRFKSEAGSNSFVLTPHKWIDSTNAIGLISKSGKYGSGTFAHSDIAFEFASWISPEFKLYLIKEFQRLKIVENERLVSGWDVKRMLTKINYCIHTDAIKEHLVPNKILNIETGSIFANEADILNKALFGMTAKEWRDKNPNLEGNIRDYVDVTQLVCLANLESFNAEFIRHGLSLSERLFKLNEIAIIQMKSLITNKTLKKLQ